MVYYLEAPNGFESRMIGSKLLFIAGGISGCPNWQQELVDSLGHLLEDRSLTIINPRRENFDINNSAAAYEQIHWEYYWLNKADMISYWFAKETIQPIVLYELGRFINTTKPIFIGYHTKYPRKQDVVFQTKLARPNFLFAHSLEELAKQIYDFIV
jgi:hypothetical protein